MPEKFVAELGVLLLDAGLDGPRAVEATTAAGRRLSRSTVSRWLRETTAVMPIRALDSFLTGCAAHVSVNRAAWHRTRERTALAITSPVSAPANGHLSVVDDAAPPHNVVALNHPPLDSLPAELRRACVGAAASSP